MARRSSRRRTEVPLVAWTSVLRVLVHCFQAVGIFPYTWPRSSPPTPLKLNIYLCLWTLSVKLFTLGLSLLALSVGLDKFEGTTVGALVLMLSGLSFMVGFPVGILFLTARSGSLARILHEFDLCISALLRKKKLNSYLKINRNLGAYLVLSLVGLTVFVVDTIEKENEVVLRYIYIWYQVYIEMVILLVLFLFTASLDILLEMLDNGVKEATASKENDRDEGLRVPGSITRGREGEEEPLQEVPSLNCTVTTRLRKLSQIIEKVEDLRQELSTCLSTCMHWIYLLSLILVIAVCFNCLSGTTSLSGLFKLLHTPVFFLLFTCQAAQRFSEKVGAAAARIQRFGYVNVHIGLHIEVLPLVQTLNGLRPFDLCGWCTLGNHTLISMGSFVATYLVVLLQVGWQPMHIELSGKNNTQ